MTLKLLLLLGLEPSEASVVVGHALFALWTGSVDGHLSGRPFCRPFVYHPDIYRPYTYLCPYPCPFCPYPYHGLYRRRTSIYCWAFVQSAVLAKETLVKNDEMVLPVYLKNPGTRICPLCAPCRRCSQISESRATTLPNTVRSEPIQFEVGTRQQ